jgi:hypothetical protein
VGQRTVKRPQRKAPKGTVGSTSGTAGASGAGGWCVNDRNAAKTVSRKGRHDRLQPLHTGTSQPSAVGRLRVGSSR